MKTNSGLGRAVVAIALGVLFMSGSAGAAQLTVDASGTLRGATGVLVGNNYFDVSFKEGSCYSLFSNCGSSTTLASFAFDDASGAQLAAQALLDQVFVDLNSWHFDTQPSKTYGIESGSNIAKVYTPFAYNASSHRVDLYATFNEVVETQDKVLLSSGASGLPYGTDTGNSTVSPQAVYAVWTPANPVPEPETYAMLLTGLGLLGVIAKRRKP